MNLESVIGDLKIGVDLNREELLELLISTKKNLESFHSIVSLVEESENTENLDLAEFRSWVMEQLDSSRIDGWYLIQENQIGDKTLARYSQAYQIWQLVGESKTLKTNQFYWIGSKEIISQLTKLNLIK